MMTAESWRWALHMAGHQIAADALAVWIPDRVTIKPEAGVCCIALRGRPHFCPSTRREVFEVDALSQAISHAVICYAGHAATLTLPGAGDMGEENALASGAGSDWRHAGALLAQDPAGMAAARIRACMLVAEHSEHISLLARMLCDRGGEVSMLEFWRWRARIEAGHWHSDGFPAVEDQIAC